MKNNSLAKQGNIKGDCCLEQKEQNGEALVRREAIVLESSLPASTV